MFLLIYWLLPDLFVWLFVCLGPLTISSIPSWILLEDEEDGLDLRLAFSFCCTIVFLSMILIQEKKKKKRNAFFIKTNNVK